MLKGLDRLITIETGMPVHIADNPLDCVAMGAVLVGVGGADTYLDVLGGALPDEEVIFLLDVGDYGLVELAPMW